ncbi:hypothetical protein BMS3Abin16_00539 [archaeon BMS3Abin16]|nr:hypothetical protein BMS3Abin16_00539 [archaeon BMS3Abin16]HDY74250.1 hypothetical protein [Euryarchaeota archaeon]
MVPPGTSENIEMVNIVPLNFRCKKYGRPLKWSDLQRRRCIGLPEEEKSCQNLYTYWEHLPEEIEA